MRLAFARRLQHEDEFFGKQQVYREHFYVSVPYRIDGDRPETMEFVIKSQGCWDGGLCYPPQVWTEESGAAAAVDGEVNPNLSFGNSSADSVDSEFVPVDEAFKPILIPIDGNTQSRSRFRMTLQATTSIKTKFRSTARFRECAARQTELPKGKIQV